MWKNIIISNMLILLKDAIFECILGTWISSISNFYSLIMNYLLEHMAKKNIESAL